MGIRRPRQYAAEILATADRNARKRLLRGVPESLRPLVKRHVELTWERRRRVRMLDH